MKHILFLLFICGSLIARAQTKPKTEQVSQTDMNKMLEEAMKAEGMSKEEQAEMKKMMEGITPDLMEQNANTADYPTFSSNSELIPTKDVARINAISKKKVSASDISAYAATLYNKLMAKGEADEISLVKQVLGKATTANAISDAAITAMLQGHPEAAMALSMKAVQLSPANTNYQNNMAALLTQYGYAEQAIPVLQKLEKEFPDNGTVLSNLAHAWLSLGETDSAETYANGAIRVNPSHPEALQVDGLIDEVNGGDPIGKYTEAMQSAPNDFTNTLIKNKGGKGTLDWNKIKRNIAIYEYFPRDWMQMPAPLSNDVKGYSEDYAVKTAYSEMVSKLTEEIDHLTEGLEQELDNLVDLGEDVFVKKMAQESIKGLNWMSRPATEVMLVLHAYQLQVQTSLADSLNTILTWKSALEEEKNTAIRKIYEKIDNNKGTICEQFKTELDALENEYMRQVNTRMRNLLVNNADQYRQWLNAWITWDWYIVGNVKNSLLMQDLASTAYLVSIYGQIVDMMEVLPEHCGVQVDEVKKTIQAPKIPDFTCPAVVSIPAGNEWNQLSNTAKNLDANKYAIKKAATPVPNVSVAYGVGNMIAQPGIAPFIKTAGGDIMPATGDGDELAPIPNIPLEELEPLPHFDGTELAPIPKIPFEELAPIPNTPLEKLEPLRDLRKSQLAKELLKKMMTADCKNVRNTKDVLKESLEKMRKLADELDELGDKDQAARDRMKKLSDELDEFANAVQQTGLQPTISSGVQAQNTFTPTRGLFN